MGTSYQPPQKMSGKVISKMSGKSRGTRFRTQAALDRCLRFEWTSLWWNTVPFRRMLPPGTPRIKFKTK